MVIVVDKLNYMFRPPKFPYVVDTGTVLIACKSGVQANRRLAKKTIDVNDPSDVIDVTGAGFSFYPEHLTITPLTLKMRWTKREYIQLYNERKGIEFPEYSMRSLSNKRFDKIFADIMEILEGKVNS